MALVSSFDRFFLQLLVPCDAGNFQYFVRTKYFCHVIRWNRFELSVPTFLRGVELERSRFYAYITSWIKKVVASHTNTVSGRIPLSTHRLTRGLSILLLLILCNPNNFRDWSSGNHNVWISISELCFPFRNIVVRIFSTISKRFCMPV